MAEFGDRKIVNILEAKFKSEIRDVFAKVYPRGFEGVTAEELDQALMDAFIATSEEKIMGTGVRDAEWKMRASLAMSDFTLWLEKRIGDKNKARELVNNFWEPIKDEYTLYANQDEND
jgi:hypothetical protein